MHFWELELGGELNEPFCKTMVRWAYYTCLCPLESFRLEDENEYEYEIKVKVFARVLKKKDTPENFILLFFTKEVSTVIDTEGDLASPNFDKLFPPLRHSC